MIICLHAQCILKRVRRNLIYLLSSGLMLHTVDEIKIAWEQTYKYAVPRTYVINNTLKSLVRAGQAVKHTSNGWMILK